MTKARALQLLADLVGDDPDYAPALEALAPKTRKAAEPTRRAAACKTILRELRRPDGFGSRIQEEAAYLDAFGAHGTPEREAQAAKLRTLEDGPSREDFGAPERFAYVTGEDYRAELARRAEHDQAETAWRLTPSAGAFEAALAVHEARRAQFAYAPPKTRKDDERATYALAVLARTTIETETPAALAA